MVEVKKSYIVEKKGVGRQEQLNVWGKVVTIGNAELAARLGSIVTFDRRGDVIWMDNFEAVFLNWEHAAVGTGAEIVLSAASRALNGSQSCKMTTADASGSLAAIFKKLRYPVKGKLGFELSFTHSSDISDHVAEIWLYDGSYIHKAGIVYNTGFNALYYHNSAGVATKIADITGMESDDWLFNKLKFVVDFYAEKYMRVIFNETEYSLADIAYQKVVDTTTMPHLYSQFYIRSDVDDNVTVYVDDVIITQNEP